MLPRRNILVIRLTALGDVLMTMPAVKAIKHASPDARLTWLVEGPVAKLLEGQDFIDRVIAFPRARVTANLKKGTIRASALELRNFVRSLRDVPYDFVLDFHGILKSGLFSALARGKTRLGFGRPLAREGSWLFTDTKVRCPELRLHKVERNMLLARQVGADGATPGLTPVVDAADEAYADEFVAGCVGDCPVVAVNPFCSRGSGFKRWSLESYARLVASIEERLGAQVLLLWGPGEREEAQRLKSLSGGRGTLCCPTDITQLLALLRRTTLYVGGDTGVMHLATLARTPVVAIFGPTDHIVNGPFGAAHVVVRHELPCSPCRNKGCTDRKCLDTISADEVFGHVERLFTSVRA